MQYGSQRTRGPWGPSDWKDEEQWLARRAEFTREGDEAGAGFDRYRSRHRGWRGPEQGWPREWGQAADHDYRQWREEQLRIFDEDYDAWRSERYRKFSQEFDEWRRNRQQEGSGRQ